MWNLSSLIYYAGYGIACFLSFFTHYLWEVERVKKEVFVSDQLTLKYATDQLKTKPRFSIANSTDADVKQTITDAKQQPCTEKTLDDMQRVVPWTKKVTWRERTLDLKDRLMRGFRIYCRERGRGWVLRNV